MVLPVGALAPSAIRNLGIISGGVNRGLSATSIQGLLRTATGSGIRRVELLAAMRHLRGQAEAGLHVRNIRRDRLPDVSRLPRARTTILSNFSYSVEVRGSRLPQDPSNKQHLTIRSSVNLTRDQILEQAAQAIEEAEDQDYLVAPGEVQQLVVVSALRR